MTRLRWVERFVVAALVVMVVAMAIFVLHVCAEVLSAAEVHDPLPPLPAVVFSTHGMVPVLLTDRMTIADTGSDYHVGEFTHDPASTGTDTILTIRVKPDQSLHEQWVTLEHEKVHLALYVRGIQVPTDLEEDIAEAIAQERVAEMEYQLAPEIVPEKH